MNVFMVPPLILRKMVWFASKWFFVRMPSRLWKDRKLSSKGFLSSALLKAVWGKDNMIKCLMDPEPTFIEFIQVYECAAVVGEYPLQLRRKWLFMLLTLWRQHIHIHSAVPIIVAIKSGGFSFSRMFKSTVKMIDTIWMSTFRYKRHKFKFWLLGRFIQLTSLLISPPSPATSIDANHQAP